MYSYVQHYKVSIPYQPFVHTYVFSVNITTNSHYFPPQCFPVGIFMEAKTLREV